MPATYSDAEVQAFVARCDARDHFVVQHTHWAPSGPANITCCYYEAVAGSRYCLCWERSAADEVVAVWTEEPPADFDPVVFPFPERAVG